VSALGHPEGESVSAQGSGSPVGAPAMDAELQRRVLEGLQQPHKSLPAALFYDDEGTRLFQQITALPEYYLTRAEDALLRAQALPVKLVFPLVICFLPGIFLSTIAPVMLQLMQIAGGLLRTGQ